MAGSMQQSNFTHLRAHDEQLVRLGLLAERYFAEDPNTCLLKLRKLTEQLAQMVASNVGLFTSPDEKQVDLLRRLQDQSIVPHEVGGLFTEVRIKRYKEADAAPRGKRTARDVANLNEARGELLAMSAHTGEFSAAVRCLLVASGLKHLVRREELAPLAVAAEDV